MSIGFGTGMGLRFGEIREYDKETLKKYNRIINMMRNCNANVDGYNEVQGLMNFMKQENMSGQYGYYEMCIAYAQLMAETVDKCNWVMNRASMHMTQAEKSKFQSEIQMWDSEPCGAAVQNTKVDQLHERMRQGDWKPAQIADISTEYLQHLRDEGMSYDKIADAVGMSKSGVAARLKGYIPKNTNK